MFIPDPDFFPIPDPEIKKAPDPGSQISYPDAQHYCYSIISEVAGTESRTAEMFVELTTSLPLLG
jgi:hypothetical protein